MYVLYQTHLQFLHIQHSVCFFQVYAGIVNHIHHCQGIFMHIDTLSRHIQACSATFSTLDNPHIFATLPYPEPGHI